MLRNRAKFIIVCWICIASVLVFTNSRITRLTYDLYEDGTKRGEITQTNESVGKLYNNLVTMDTLFHTQELENGHSVFRNYSVRHRNISSTTLDDIFISVKTTRVNHKFLKEVLMETWINVARKQTYIFTETYDADLWQKAEAGHVINTNCSIGHNRKSLVCKMAQEFDWFISSKKQWFCHVDDDNYLNVQRLVIFLQQYNHTDDWYLGRPNRNYPKTVKDRSNPGKNLTFWFALGGAGFCISEALAVKMVPYAGGDNMMQAAERIGLADDCAIGYIIDNILHTNLTVIKRFHSHVEGLRGLRVPLIKDQITLSYRIKDKRKNLVTIKGFPYSIDPTRFLSVHCYLYPASEICSQLKT